MKNKLDLTNIRKELQTQDNQCTAEPIFLVEEKTRVYGFDPIYSEEAVFIDMENGGNEVDLEEYGLTREEAENETGLAECGYADEWNFVNAHFTDRAANEYIEKNKYRYSGELRVMVDTMLRCPEMIAIRKALLEGQLYLLEWKDASEKPERTETTYLYSFKNDSGKTVTLTAYYFGPNELELDYDTEPFEGCTCPNEDEYYCPAGWYELGYESENCIRLPQDGTWCELPRYAEASNV